MAEELTPDQQAAAFHGLATNAAMPVHERLACALTALGMYEAEVERLRAVARDHACIPVEYAYAEGYTAAVAALRDDERYRNWWSADGAWQHKTTGRYWDGTGRRHLADYLETVGPRRRATGGDSTDG